MMFTVMPMMFTVMTIALMTIRRMMMTNRNGRPPKTDRTAIAQSREGENDRLFPLQYIQLRPPYSYFDHQSFPENLAIRWRLGVGGLKNPFLYFHLYNLKDRYHLSPKNIKHNDNVQTSGKPRSMEYNDQEHLDGHPLSLLRAHSDYHSLSRFF